jgi:6-phosphogluconolactonase (cycloisomerase 2 family)
MLLFVNLTNSMALSLPGLGVTLDGSPMVTQRLAVDGLGSFQALDAIGAGQVWATLIPDRDNIEISASVQIGGATVSLTEVALPRNSVRYGKFVAAAVADTNLAGFDALALSADGNHIYAVDSSRDALVVIDAADLTQRQLLKEGADGVKGLEGARSVAVSPDGRNVYVASPDDRQIAVFARDTVTGNLTFVITLDAMQSGGGIDALVFDPTGSRLYAAGPDGITVYARALGTPAITTEAESDNATSGDVDTATTADLARAIDLAGSLAPTATPNVFSASVTGTVNPGNDRDFFRVEAAAGDVLSLAMRGSPGGGGSLSDTLLRVFDRSGVQIAFNDDSAGTADARVTFGGFTYSGSYYVAAESFGTFTGTYTLDASITRAGVRSITSEAEANNQTPGDVVTASAADRAIATDWTPSFAPTGAGNVFRATVTGAVTSGVDRDLYRIVAAPGDTLTLDLRGSGVGPLSDPFLRLFDAQGNQIAFNDDSGGTANSFLTYSGFDRPGYYYIDAESFGSSAGSYTLVATHTRATARVGGVSLSGGASALATSVDGTLLYVASAGTDTLRVLNASTLATLQTLAGPATAGLDGASAIATSSDDRFVYVTARDGDSVSVFARSGSALTHVQTLVNGTDGVRGTLGASDVALSPDGRFVMVTGSESNAIAVFGRDAASGRLSFLQVVRNGVGGTSGLVAPTALVASADGAHVYASTLGATGLPGGIASFDNVVLGLAMPEPSIDVTTFTGIESLGVTTASGDDTMRLRAAPTASTMTIGTGIGSDIVIAQDIAATTTINLGTGTDEAQLRSERSGTTLVVNGGNGRDLISIDRSGASSTTRIVGGTGQDTVRVAGANIPISATTILDATDTDAAPYDILVFDPGSTNPNAFQFSPTGASPNPVAGTLQAGTRSGATFTPTAGLVQYSNFEGVQIISAPIVTVPAPSAILEGGSVRLVANVTPLGTTNSLSEPVAWDLDGDGRFGDAVGADITLTWAQLVDLGLDDDGRYPIAARAVNGDGIASTASTTLVIGNVLPVVTVTGPSTVAAGQPLVIGYGATDPGDDRITEWRIDWGDGSALEVLGADVVTAQHVYVTPGNYQVRVGGVDEDTTPAAVFSAPKSVSVTGDAALVSAGGPYVIREGESLTLTGRAPGAVTGYRWDINGDGFTDASGSTVTLTWAQLQAIQNPLFGTVPGGPRLPVNDSGLYGVRLTATYAAGIAVTSAPVPLTILNTAPTATFAASGPVNEGGSATVSFGGAFDPSNADTAAQFRFSVDFDNDGDYDDATDVRDAAASTLSVPTTLLADGGTRTIRGRIADKDGGATEILRDARRERGRADAGPDRRRQSSTRARRTGSTSPRPIPAPTRSPAGSSTGATARSRASTGRRTPSNTGSRTTGCARSRSSRSTTTANTPPRSRCGSTTSRRACRRAWPARPTKAVSRGCPARSPTRACSTRSSSK